MRQRAAVLIGVRKTGGLPTLQAVDDGVGRMTAWLAGQPGFRDAEPVIVTMDGHDATLDARIVTLTDAAGPVTATDVRKWIRAFVELGTVEQLFVYFAGHGVNIRFGEYWLLSGAPDEPNEAVNVRGSVDLARYCGIPHVVFLSDACRTAADSIQAQAVEGSLVFPNSGPNDQPGCVDVFYASMVGRPALEVRDAAGAANGFQAIYTEALVDGLNGTPTDLVEPISTDDPPLGRVRPWPLKRYLQTEVPKRLVARGVVGTLSQKPDAVITSEPEEWLAAVDVAPARRSARRGPPPPPPPPAPGASMPPADESSLADTAQEALRSALRGDVIEATPVRRTRGRGGTGTPPPSEGAALFATMHARVAETPTPGHFETQCGFRVTGIGIADVASGAAGLELVDGPGGVVRVTGVAAGRPAANVLLVFEDGRGALLPAIPGFIGALTYDADAGELASVEYEPSDNSALYAEAAAGLPERRALRRVISAAAALGAFRLDERTDREALIDRMREANGADPSMAVYAAYALHDMGRRDDVVEIGQHLRGRLGLGLFDVAMLARTGATEPSAMPGDVFPAVPMLAQGWGLVDARQVRLPASLRAADVRRHVTGSLWTLFDAQGVALVRAAITSGEIDG